ncbi:family 16 glycosylhydrolase [Sinomonas sp. JGH33]|uniref:Family 16 glycosylhydrolase n=1 Tax=Sinomonas terricola TaxID=3110330 RepID=A0ABU5T693_9MICC|nr:family 16 glycosylhydrolase [Sinomonas sp. JGH33]MEA5455192.1 family 16 glycosylhydrolase [Sinomonas sp. JGH33]
MRRITAVAVALVLLLTGCTAAAAVNTDPQPVGWTGAARMLAFRDEFNGTSLNRTVWTPYWRRDCVGASTMNSVHTCSSNVSYGNGEVDLKLSDSTHGALLSTNPRDGVVGHTGFQFTTGYAEARIWFPGPAGACTIYNWPAWLTDGQSWPSTGEIDIAEAAGWGGSGADYLLSANYHGPNKKAGSGTFSGCWSNGWHTYAIDRKVGSIDIYVDGAKVWTTATTDHESPEYLILALGYTDGIQGLGDANAVRVDYVRVWH